MGVKMNQAQKLHKRVINTAIDNSIDKKVTIF